MKTYASGGYWKGKNYLFDKRMEQTPEVKGIKDVESDIDSKCCLCRTRWTIYRGQFKCNRSLCRVPVIVCESCASAAAKMPESLVCELCREGYRAPTVLPDLVSLKRKAEEILDSSSRCNISIPKQCNKRNEQKVYYKDRLFIRRLPLTVTASKIKHAIGPEVTYVNWICDKDKLFYGSCIIQMRSEIAMKTLLERISAEGGLKIMGKKVKLSKVFMRDDSKPFDDFDEKEYPPVGH